MKRIRVQKGTDILSDEIYAEVLLDKKELLVISINEEKEEIKVSAGGKEFAIEEGDLEELVSALKEAVDWIKKK